MVERSQQLGELADRSSRVQDWLFDLSIDADPNTPASDHIQGLQSQFEELVLEMESRRNAHELLLAQVREGDFVETGSVRSMLGGVSTDGIEAGALQCQQRSR